MKRLREFLESIAFAGLKPGAPKAPGAQFGWLGPLSRPLERFLSGGANNDPLYLTNRTTNQKVFLWALIGIPCLLLLIGIGVTTSNLLDPPEAKPVKELTAKELAAKMLPDMARDIKLPSNPDVQVMEISVQRGGAPRLAGIVHNNTSHDIAVVDLVIDLTDESGTQLGGVSGTVEKVPAHSNKNFQFPIKQKDAAFALVRDIVSR